MTSQDSQPESLYAAREPIFPRRVKGRFRTLKWWLMGAMLGIYYITPWIRWDRGPHLPDQAVLIDMSGRRFFFFMIEIWPHEFYFVAGLLIMAGLGLFLFTSARGPGLVRLCLPADGVDRPVHPGRALDRGRPQRPHPPAPAALEPAEKLRKNIFKWWVWFLSASPPAAPGSSISPTRRRCCASLSPSPPAPVAYITMLVLTFTTFFFGGFAREQICIYACPWPRIQAAMMDEDTITIGYRDWRGEPRGKHKGERPRPQRRLHRLHGLRERLPDGHRHPQRPADGLHHLRLCIDACDDVMDKIGKPRGLVGYMALTDEARERAGQPPTSRSGSTSCGRARCCTPRCGPAVGIGLVVALFLRTDIEMNVTPVRNPPFVTLSDGSIRDTYDLRLRNKHGEDRWFTHLGHVGCDASCCSWRARHDCA